MSRRIYTCVILAVVCASAAAAQELAKSAAERGALAVRGQPAMSPPIWSERAFGDVWQQWGLATRPADFDQRFRERYGLHSAPYENAGLPMGLHYAQGPFGKGVSTDCLLCHAGVVAGQTIIGLSNSALDMQTMFEELGAQSKLPIKSPVQLSYVRGTVDSVNPVTFLMTLRDLDLNLTRTHSQPDFSKDVVSDPPAWWLLKRKTTRNWTGNVNVNSLRVDMVNLLTPLNSPEDIKKHETTFADIHAFVMSVEPPKYPFAIDADLAKKGLGVFTLNCEWCHGTYGTDREYPDRIVPLDTLGTDPTLARSITKKNVELFNQTWLAKEEKVKGEWYNVAEISGYQAPPLDGVWATAPYLHNASVPTIYHVLNSKARPKVFTRSFRSEKDDYDVDRLGWKVTILDRPPDSQLPPHEQRRIYDTSLPGRGNAGHTFGDKLSEDERRAVIEYLKTL
jgi:hypothetical protein